MHYGFFGLLKPPFEPPENPEHFFEGGNRREILESILFGLNQVECIFLLGNPGSGKSTLIRSLKLRIGTSLNIFHAKESLESWRTETSRLVDSLGGNSQKNSLIASLDELQNEKVELTQKSRDVILMLEGFEDESDKIWQQISIFIGICKKLNGTLKIILIGKDSILNRVNMPPDLATYKFHLEELEQNESMNYIRHKIELAGGENLKIFKNQAIEKIVSLSNGSPQMLDHLCQRSLESAFIKKEKIVTNDHVNNVGNFDHSNLLYEFFSGNQKTMQMEQKSYLAISATGFVFFGVAIYALISNISDDINQRQYLEIDNNIETVVSLAIADKEKTALPLQDANELGKSIITDQMDKKTEGNSLLDDRLLQTLNFLGKADGSEFSVQLLGGADMSVLRRQMIEISTLINIDQIFAFRTLAQNKPYISILYGNFKTLDAAKKAIDALPKKLKTNRPYLRTTKGIKAEIKANSPYLKP